VVRVIRQGQFPENFPVGPHPKVMANQAINPSSHMQQGVALYLERFAYFFSRTFFLRMAFENLNAEVKAEHAGFRRASETLRTASTERRMIYVRIPWWNIATPMNISLSSI